MLLGWKRSLKTLKIWKKVISTKWGRKSPTRLSYQLSKQSLNSVGPKISKHIRGIQRLPQNLANITRHRSHSESMSGGRSKALSGLTWKSIHYTCLQMRRLLYELRNCASITGHRSCSLGSSTTCSQRRDRPLWDGLMRCSSRKAS